MNTIPVIILAGSDHRPGPLPETENNLHSIGAYKGAVVEVDGKPLIQWLVETLKRVDDFGTISIAGPAEVYGPLKLDAELIDTNGSVASNLRAALQCHCDQYGESAPVAILTYDILLSVSQFKELGRLYRENSAGCTFWMPFVEMPRDKDRLGAFRWKPSYHFLADQEDSDLTVLPGHFAILRPDRIDWTFLFQLLDSAYQTRNQSIGERKRRIAWSVFLSLVKADIGRLLSLKQPDYLYRILVGGLNLAARLRKGNLRLSKLESLIGKMFLTTEARKLLPEKRQICFPVVNILNLAEDVDTEEEAVDARDSFRKLLYEENR